MTQALPEIFGIEDASPSEVEEARLVSLVAEELERSTDPVFDAIANAAALLTGCPIALVTMMGADRQWYKAQCGFSGEETPRDISFCTHAVDGRIVIESLDMQLDPRFKDNPLVRGAEKIRYYLGLPLRARNGQVLGTLCVIDRVPRKQTSPDVRQALEGLAQTVEELLAARSIIRMQKAKLDLVARLNSQPERDDRIPLDAEGRSGRDWATRIAESDAKTSAEAKPSRSQWETVIRAAVRGALANENVEANVSIADISVMRPPVIFARIVFSMLQEVIGLDRGGAPIEVELKRQAGFVLFSISIRGTVPSANQEIARWMRTEGGVFNTRHEDGWGKLLAWFPIVAN